MGLLRMTLRIPEDMHARIKALAAQERRSFHAQLLVLLADALRRARLRSES